MTAALQMLLSAGALADSPFAALVIDYQPAPGQFVNQPAFNNPGDALGPPIGGGTSAADNTSKVTLGGFGGSITLAFDHTVLDDPANPFGLDAIVFGNAFYVGGDPNRHWAECGHIEISRDVNGNGVHDDDEPWYLILGSHITDPNAQFETQTWDDDIEDPTFPPANPGWIPPGQAGIWQTAAYLLPEGIFAGPVVENPNGPAATDEGVYGYVDFSPTLLLGDLDGDDVVDDPSITAEEFYTFPDDAFTVGITNGSGGGDAFDIGSAVDPETMMPAGLDGFDFLRLSTAVNSINGALGEMSTEIDAVADVAPGLMGDHDADGDVDLDDFAALVECMTGPDADGVPTPCQMMNFDADQDVDLKDFGGFQAVFGTVP